MIGLFIGTSISSLVLFVFRIIPISSLGMIIILYLYAVVGGITGFVVHKRVEGNPKVEATQKVEKPTPEEKVEKKNVNPIPKHELVKTIDYREVLDKINTIKKTSTMIRNLIETRKRIEELKKESNFILEDTVKVMDSKSRDLTMCYLETG